MTAARADAALTTCAAPYTVTDGSHARLVPVGELDIATAPAFLRALSVALERRPLGVEIDLRWLTFIDARSVGAIAAAAVRLERGAAP